MKVTVKDYLNVRVGKPSLIAPTFQYLAPGSEIEIDGQLYKGDPYEGVDTWVKDLAGNYYWSGGFEGTQLPKSIQIGDQPFSEKDFWWINDFGINNLWSARLSGTDIKIAILDSGLALPHKDLKIKEENLTDITKSKSGIIDKLGHGTHVSGIVIAINDGFGIRGIASESDFYFAKITHDLYGDSINYLSAAITWAVGKQVDIISISEGFATGSTALLNALQSANQKNILVVCAAGNRSKNEKDILYPAKYGLPNMLSIGGITKIGSPLPDTINTQQTDLFAPGENILSTYLNSSYQPLSGSSQAAPYVAGVAGLCLEHLRKTNPNSRPIAVRDILLTKATVSSFGKTINPKSILL